MESNGNKKRKRRFSDQQPEEAAPPPDRIDLSVIVPVYNMENYLGESLDSILSQKVERLEVLVVDSGSTDNSRRVIKEYAKKNRAIRPIYSDTNLWASKARNLAMEQARGQYIAFCDADDTIPDNTYQKMLKAARTGKADIVIGNYTHKYLDGIRNPVIYTRPDPFGRALEQNNISFCNKMFLRSFVGNTRFPVDMRTAEDGLFTLDLYRKHPRISCLDDVVYVYTLEKADREETKLHNQRDLSVNALQDSLTLLKRTFHEPILLNGEIWSEFYLSYLSFAFYNIWMKILDPDERGKGFESIKQTVLLLCRENELCDFRCNGLDGSFAERFGIPFSDFCSLDYSSYIMLHTVKFGRDDRSVVNAFIYGCSTGNIGLRTILSALKGWLKHKLKKS